MEEDMGLKGGGGGGHTLHLPQVSNLTTLQHVYTTLALTICVRLHSHPVFDLNWRVRIGAAELSGCRSKPLAVPTTPPEFTLRKKNPSLFQMEHDPKWRANMQKQRRRDIDRRGKSDAAAASCRRCWLVHKNIASISPHPAAQSCLCAAAKSDMSRPKDAEDLPELWLKIFTTRPRILRLVGFLIVVTKTEAPAASHRKKMNRDR